MNTPNIVLSLNDLPEGVEFPTGLVAIDTETTGLSLTSDRLCLAQLGDGLGNVWLVKFDGTDYSAPRLRAVLENPRLVKLFHFARFDLAMLRKWLKLDDIHPFFCTKIASKLLRPHEGKHNLRTLCKMYVDVDLDKTEQISNWAADELTDSQKMYAASDVLYLHQIFMKMVDELTEANLSTIMHQSLAFLATRVEMDLRGLPEGDLFSHSGW
jgi:ribonuclease D